MTARKSGGQRESGSAKPRLMACNVREERKAVTFNFLPRDFDASPGVFFVFFGGVQGLTSLWPINLFTSICI